MTSKLRSGHISQVAETRSQNVGTGTSEKLSSRKLASIADGQRNVMGKESGFKNLRGQPSAPVRFRFDAPGAGKPSDKKVTE